ncbi:hypothetical protein OX283_006535 [Flavobacterium sp. SUN052]|uniref:hypothetical protein n=1 Tax=Flavobacterium sp. SUN052 TaxID=3002441 RepID=UPI00237D762B|nr:hypothetical protein [Flavobacterium sp. SUN052]MEC4004306.1 hypothetical protein [Flavobacterium sp. SUN052]
MKKLLFGLIATVMFGFVGNAQKTTKEDVRYSLSEGMASIVQALKPAYKSGITFETFEKTVTGNSRNTEQGRKLLVKVFEYEAQGTSRDQILKEYSGSEMAEACLFVNDVYKNNPKSDGRELFGGTTGDFNPYPATIQGKGAPCRWWQLGCWLNQIFGESGGNAIISAIVDFVIGLIIP